jgi:hypothetical protein
VANHPPCRADRSIEIRAFIVFFALLILIYGTWLMVFWPGIVGTDGLAILLQVKNPDTFNGNKTAFWYNYVWLLYWRYHRVEIPIGLIMILSAFVMARILGWCWAQRLFRTAIFLLIFICIAPHLIDFIGLLYPDGFFAVSVAGLLFEVGLIGQRRDRSLLSWLTLAITFPFAVFGRTNGIIFLIPVAALIFTVSRADRYWIGIIIIGWCGLVVMTASHDKQKNQGALYPMTVYETVNFLQPRLNNFATTPRVSQRTLEALTRSHPLALYLSHYDPDYWDSLNFDPNGPSVMALPEHDRDIIVREFFRYNLWHNIPKFIGSRVNIFLVTALAEGDHYIIINPVDFEKYIWSKVGLKSTYRKFNLYGTERLLRSIDEYDWQCRWLLWTPFLGIGLTIWLLSIGIRERDMVFLLVSITMVAQLVGIFIFSIAGEYRYLLHFFTLPLAFLPMIVVYRRQKSEVAATTA